jgi:hypothetical protein
MSELSFYISPLSVTVTGSRPTMFTLPETFSGDVTANVTWPANTFNSLFPISGESTYTTDLSRWYFIKSFTLVSGSYDLSTQNVFPRMSDTRITYGTNSGLITSTMAQTPTNTTIADEYLCYLNNKIKGSTGQTAILNVSTYTNTLNISINIAILNYLQSVVNSTANLGTPNVNLFTSYLIYSQIASYDTSRFGGNIVNATGGGGWVKNLLKPGDIIYFQCTITTSSTILDSTGNIIPNRIYLVKITLT